MNDFAIIIHGDAEDKSRTGIGPEKEAGFRQGLSEALERGWQILNNGGSPVAAVKAAVRSMEDNPLFNAARGGALTIESRHEFDAAIMHGKTLQAGSVAGVKNARNPINPIRAIMERSQHVMLGGEGAKAFAQIAIDPTGEIALEYETQLMFKGYRQGNDKPFIAIWED